MPTPTPTPIPAADFATRQIGLIDAEVEAELAETGALLSQSSPAALCRAGLAITNLVEVSQRTGMGGRTVVELARDPATTTITTTASAGAGRSKRTGSADLAEHSIRTGDIVAIQQQPAGSARKKEKQELKDTGVEGVVMKVTASAVCVACSQKDNVEVPAGRLWM